MIKILLVFLLSGCVASQDYVEETADLLHDLAFEISHEFPENEHFAEIARKTSNHAESSGGFDFSWITQLLGMIGGGESLALGLLTALGIASPGLGRKKKSSP